jgi:hypothetical protein
MNQQAKTRHNVTVTVLIQHNMPGIESDSPEEAAQRAATLAREELAELYSKDLPPWFAIANMKLLPEEPLQLAVSAEGEEVSHWKVSQAAGGRLRPAYPDHAQEALAFVARFVELFDKDVLFAWDDKAMRKLREEALAILNKPMQNAKETVSKPYKKRSKVADLAFSTDKGKGNPSVAGGRQCSAPGITDTAPKRRSS